jgi:FKBP-type peptidyl-prolyl cis-trans isomerase
MSSIRLVASLLAGGLLLAGCQKEEPQPFVYTADGQAKAAPAAAPTGAAPAPAPASAPAAAAPAAPAATPAAAQAADAVPPSGNPATMTNPKFYLPTDAELTTTASGLKYKMIREGSGTSPVKTGGFTAHYCGWYTNGEVFDSSYARNEPLSYAVYKMIPGWQEALVMMKPGSEYILVVSPKLGYGVDGGNGIPPNSTLVFRMELLSTSG